MTRNFRFLLLTCILWLLPVGVVAAGQLLLKGVVLDGAGQPVGGAEVYVFDSANVKRPADFISEKTGGDGSFHLALPPGRYWTMAVRRQGESRLGPLGPNDLFSGAPLAFEGAADKQITSDFTVMTLKDAALRSHKRNEDLVKVAGRIVDPAGNPVAGAYAMADLARKGELPLYLSTWTEADGGYTLFLPKGEVFLGVSHKFPPGNDYLLDRKAEFHEDTVGVDLVTPELAAKQADLPAIERP